MHKGINVIYAFGRVVLLRSIRNPPWSQNFQYLNLCYSKKV